MTWLGALLPVKDGVAVHKSLLDEADRRKAAGDPRSRGAIMADTLVRRVLAPHMASADGPAELPLMINIVVPDTVLLGNSNASGFVEGFGSVPGDLLREWIATHAEQGVQDWVRRLYQQPSTGQLVAMDKDGRKFDGRLAEYLRLRDRYCRNRWCNAPIRHLDHAKDHAKGGRTSAHNGQGAVRGVQPRQAGPRLEREAPRRARPHHRDHHPDRAPLPLHRPDHRASPVDGDLPRHGPAGAGRLARLPVEEHPQPGPGVLLAAHLRVVERPAHPAQPQRGGTASRSSGRSGA